jgi:hypothetical protein
MMKNLFYILFFFLLFSCKTTEFVSLKDVKEIYVRAGFAKEVKVNDKYLLDLSSDLADRFFNPDKYLIKKDEKKEVEDKSEDETSDAVSEKKSKVIEAVEDLSDDVEDNTTDAYVRDNFIFEEIRLNEIAGYKDFFSSAIIKSLQTKYEKSKIAVLDNSADVTGDGLTFCNFEILRYKIGEFNLIANIPMEITVKISIKNKKYKIDREFIKKFKVPATSQYPIERARLLKCSEDIANYIYLYINSIKIKEIL